MKLEQLQQKEKKKAAMENGTMIPSRDVITTTEDDGVLSTIGMIFALCLSLYITVVIMRRLWHRYEMRLSVIADRVVRRRISAAYRTMLERLLVQPTLMCTSTASPIVCTPVTSKYPDDCVLVMADQSSSNLRSVLLERLALQDIVLLTKDELQDMVDQATREVKGRTRFIRQRRVHAVVQRLCSIVYMEYHACMLQEYRRTLKFIQQGNE